MIYYLSGSSEAAEIERVKKVHAEIQGIAKPNSRLALNRNRYNLAHDWWTEIEIRRERGVSDADLTREDGIRFAVADLAAVRESGLLILLWPRFPSFGAGFEAGAFHQLRVDCDHGGWTEFLISGKTSHPFAQLADKNFDGDDALIRYLKKK